MKTIILAITVAAITHATAFANGSTVRGGGKGIACRSARGELKSVELLDLWESKKFYNRKIPESRRPVADQVKSAVARLRYINNYVPSMTLDPTIPPEDKAATAVWGRAQLFLNPGTEIRWLRGVSLTPTDDSYEVIRPQQPGCTIEQIVVYQDRIGQPVEILINQDLYDQLSPTQQAALIVHEALYSYLRVLEDPSSIRTRRTVGYVFAGLKFSSLNQLLPSHYTACYIKKPEATDRIPYIFFYEKDGALQAIRSHDLRYQPVLGYVPAQAEVGTFQGLEGEDQKYVRENLFNGKLCDAPYLKEPGRVIGGLITMAGTGPVDYDHTNSVSFACLADGTRELKLLQGDIIEPNGLSRARDLYCEEVEKH